MWLFCHLQIHGKDWKAENVDRGKKLRSRKAGRALDNIISLENKVFILELLKEQRLQGPGFWMRQVQRELNTCHC